MIYICKPQRVSIYINRNKKTTSQIKAETGCTALINGGLFEMSTFKPVCHLKADGQVLAKDPWKYWGFGWNTNDLQLVSDCKAYKNYIACVCLVRDGKAEPISIPAEMGGNRPRTALGVFEDGRLWLYAVTSPVRSPKALQNLALQAGVKHCVMLDGGGSTQGGTPTETINAGRIVHNYICVWEEPKEEPKEETKVEPKKEPAGVETKMFKIALGAGHGINTAGKRCLKSLDPNETREWWLNDRICDYVESYLKDYEGYSLLRLDDSDDGVTDVALATRTNEANEWGADFYLSVHHNAGINGGSGGGIVVYTHPQSSKASVEWRNALYDALIAHTGLSGNRTSPKATADYYVLRKSKMPAVLLELGFMDSKTDVPVILTNSYAQKCAKAIVEVLVQRGGLTKKQAQAETLYRVQLGAFSKRENAERLKAELEAKGYKPYITRA